MYNAIICWHAPSVLADIYLRNGNINKALDVYNNVLKVQGIPAQDKAAMQQAM